MAESKIEWTDYSWNPFTGCTKVSTGCKYCYAERVFPRAYGKDLILENGAYRKRKFTDIKLHPERLDIPLHMKKPRTIFVNSMSDLFHENVPFEYVYKIFEIMDAARQHTYQILTKRLQRAIEFFNKYCGYQSVINVLNAQHIWIGVSVENQQTADERIPLLLQIPSKVRWLSCEPLLGPIDLSDIDYDNTVGINCLTGDHGVIHPFRGRSKDKINWVVVGGESGPKARSMNLTWATDILKQCRDAGVPFFFKQESQADAPTTFRNFDTFPNALRVREYPI